MSNRINQTDSPSSSQVGSDQATTQTEKPKQIEKPKFHQEKGEYSKLVASRKNQADVPSQAHEALAKHYQNILKDPKLKPKIDLSHTLRKEIEAKAFGTVYQMKESLSRDGLRQLLRYRHQSSDKKSLFTLLKQEVKDHKKMRDEAKGPTKQTSKAEQNKQLEKASFLLRTTKMVHKLLSSSGESQFEALLKRMLEGGKSATPELANGSKAQFKAKTVSQWKSFFSKLLDGGMKEAPQSKELDQLLEALFRGVYEGEEGQKFLISDLIIKDGDREKTEKFARLQLNDDEKYNEFNRLNPGDNLEKLTLPGVESNQLEYIKMKIEGAVISTLSAEEVLQQFKNPISHPAQREMEKALIQGRKTAKAPPLFPWVWSEKAKDDTPKGPIKWWVVLSMGLGFFTIFLILVKIFNSL